MQLLRPGGGHGPLREAAASCWARRGLPTEAEAVICGPGSKALLFGRTAGIGGGSPVARPSCRYAAQAALSAGRHAALSSADPCSLPWIAASLARLEEVLADLTGR